MFDFLSDIGEAVSDGVNAAVDAVTDGVYAAVDTVTDRVNAAVDTVTGLAYVVGDIGSNAAKATSAALSDASDAISDAVSGIPNDITKMPGYLAGVWGDFWEFEIESINAIGGLLLDEAEYFADAEELPDLLRDICKGLIGSDDELSLVGVVGATLGGLGKCASDLGKWGSQLLGNPAEIAQNCYDSAKYVWQHRSEIPSKISSEISNWWNDTTTYEKITTIVEAYAMYRVFASGGAEDETVTLESEAAGVTGEAGEAAGIAAEAGEAGGMVGSEGVAAVEGAAEEAAGAIEGAAGEAAEAIEGAAGKGKIRIESACESGSGSELLKRINIDAKQLGKKWGKHRYDYPDMNNFGEYKQFANKVFSDPDKIIWDSINQEYLYVKGNDLLRVQSSGNFVSLYPGAESGKVLKAIENGGLKWEK